ncbi:hypothetical protein RI129_007014 [Pyrocoelia pectoralis]|uniref:Uncharacterized protein n=1 Tax=Pyrocoelia pectoralis TaxID=417401 RepID=A0AAN7VFS5_9COLE
MNPLIQGCPTYGPRAASCADSNNCTPMAFHCIIHQQHLCAKQLNLEYVMTVFVKSVNFIISRALNHRIFKEFLKEIECEYDDVLYHSEVRWLSRGKILKRFFALRHEIEILVKNKLICHVYADVNAFQSKLQLFIQQSEPEILVHFPTRMTELLRLLSDHFDERFTDFHELKNDIRIFENPFSIDVSTAPIELQLELIEKIRLSQVLCTLGTKTSYRRPQNQKNEFCHKLSPVRR